MSGAKQYEEAIKSAMISVKRALTLFSSSKDLLPLPAEVIGEESDGGAVRWIPPRGTSGRLEVTTPDIDGWVSIDNPHFPEAMVVGVRLLPRLLARARQVRDEATARLTEASDLAKIFTEAALSEREAMTQEEADGEAWP